MNNISDKEAFSKIGLFTANDVRRMLDVEFISELTIALLNGLQNKKDKLEVYYQIYEEEFTEEENVREIYDIVLGELLKILPNISDTRWGKKTDFYSLFLVLANHRESLPLSKDKRVLMKEKLIQFNDQIKQRLTTSNDEPAKPFPKNVEDYVKGMRATTDLSSRKNRNMALENELESIWEE